MGLVVAKIFMTTTKPILTVFEKLIQPLKGLLQKIDSRRECKVLPDMQWLETGILRALSQEPSGRGFLQSLLDSGKSTLKRSHFFETLKSKRRLKLCCEASAALFEEIRLNRPNNDPFLEYYELDEYDIYAGDGHFHKAACHDVVKEGKKHPTLHFYSVDLRTQALSHLTLADTSGNRKREHDTRALKRLSIETLRQGTSKGRKVIYVWDRAGIDFLQWYKWKQTGGIYFISREKENMRLSKMGDLHFDRNDSLNKGVESYEIVGPSTGCILYRVKYKCPITGASFSFLTNLTKVSPGLIAYLYKSRWGIEKIFDEVKNKLCEKKAWASSDTAKSMQAQFICLTHNLMLILEESLKQEGVENLPEDNRRCQRLKEAMSKSGFRKEELPEFLNTPKKASQRSVKFTRWLRNNLYSNTSWRVAISSLRQIYAVF